MVFLWHLIFATTNGQPSIPLPILFVLSLCMPCSSYICLATLCCLVAHVFSYFAMVCSRVPASFHHYI